MVHGDPLRELWRACAPSGWTVQHVEATPGRGHVILRDANGEEHGFDWRPRAAQARAFVTGRLLAFGHRTPSGVAPLASYRELLARVAAREEELAALRSVPSEPSRDRLTLTLTESALWRALASSLARSPRRSLDACAEHWVERSVAHPAIGKLVLYFESPCAQSCEFCELPRRRHDPSFRAAQALVQLRHRTPLDLVSSGAFAAVLRALSALPAPPAVVVQGHDWLTHPHLDVMLRALEGQRGLRLSLHGPHTGLAEPELAARVARLPGLDAISLTLQSSEPAVHDAIVGADGAGERVQRAIDHLRASGAPVRLVVVLTRRAIPTLGATLRWAHERHVPVSLHGFLPDRGHPDAARVYVPVAELRSALAALGDEGGAIETLMGVPVCAVPPSLRDRVHTAIVGHDSEPLVHPAPCGGCVERARCGGVPASCAPSAGVRALAEPAGELGAR